MGIDSPELFKLSEEESVEAIYIWFQAQKMAQQHPCILQGYGEDFEDLQDMKNLYRRSSRASQVLFSSDFWGSDKQEESLLEELKS